MSDFVLLVLQLLSLSARYWTSASLSASPWLPWSIEYSADSSFDITTLSSRFWALSSNHSSTMCAHPNRSMFIFWQDSRTSPPLTTPRTGNIRRWCSGRLLRRPATEWWLILRRRSRLCWGWGPSPASAQSLPWVSGHGTLHDSIKEKPPISNTLNII